MIRFDPQVPEEAVYVIDQNEAEPGTPNSGKPQYFVVNVQAEKRIEQEVVKAGAIANVRTRVYRAAADAKLVASLRRVWKSAILGARFVEKERVETRFDTYEFSTFVGLGTASAYANGRIPGTCLDELVSLGLNLAAFARAPSEKQRDLRAKLVRIADTLAKRLEAEVQQ